MEQWLESAEARALLPHPDETLDSLAADLRAGLEQLVAIAGGWTLRPPRRRLAYDSNAIRQLRRVLEDLHRLAAMCLRALKDSASPGAWPRSIKATFRPPRAAMAAAVEPASPAPTTITSAVVTALSSRGAATSATRGSRGSSRRDRGSYR